MTIDEIDAMKWLIDALDHLQQYERYSEEMRKIGRGCSISSEFSPKYLQAGIRSAIQKHLSDTNSLTHADRAKLANIELERHLPA